MKSFTTTVLVATAATTAAAAAETTAVHGCYSSLTGWQNTKGTTEVYNSHGTCASRCSSGGFPVAALQASKCFCGDAYPPASALVGDDKCGTPCPGYPLDMCGGGGGEEYYTVLDAGLTGGDACSGEGSGSTTTGSMLPSVLPTLYPTANTTMTGPASTASSISTSAPIPTAGASLSSSFSVSGIVVAGLGFLNILW